MALSNTEIENIVNKVMAEVNQRKIYPSPTTAPSSSSAGDFFNSMEDAIEAAFAAQKVLISLGLDKRREIIQSIREYSSRYNQELAELAVQETGYGRVEDKMLKNKLCIEKTPGVEDLQPEAFSGEHGLSLVELAPYGVIGSITPSTNPGATMINNTISMVSAGNAVVYSPHPAAKRISQRAIAIIREAIAAVGGPKDVVVTVKEPTVETANIMMEHPKVRLIVVTGGEDIVHIAMSKNKKAMCAGPGNPPVVVDETADILKAARDIVSGSTFDNNVLCTAEKEVFAVDTIFDELKANMVKNGMYELKGSQIDDITRLVVQPDGKINKNYVGKSANVILKDIGITPSYDVRGVIFETNKEHPLVKKEQLMPVLPLVRVSNVNQGIEYALEAEHNYLHSAYLHSKNVETMSRMATMMNTSIFVKNGPSYAGLGFGGEGFTSMTISTPTGEGITHARTFTRLRRCVLVDYFRIV